MAFWTIGTFAHMGGVSVQTLHHWDHMGLLSPRTRSQKGYRHYCEADLAKLQQIVALKFFGCELKEIKAILEKKCSLLEHLCAQERLLQDKVDALTHALTLLRQARAKEEQGQSIAWETTRELIEVYHMTQNLEHPWVKEIFNQEELKEYAAFQKELHEAPDNAKRDAFIKDWHAFVADLNAALTKMPESEEGVALAARCMTLINGIYGPEHEHLRTKKFETGFGEGKGFDETGFTKESVAWLEKAMNVYWKRRLQALFQASIDQRLSLWEVLLTDMYGYDASRRQGFVRDLLSQDFLNPEEKAWIQEVCVG